MAKTNSGLVTYCKKQVGLPYWFGTYGQKASKALYLKKKKQYPKYYKAKNFPSQYGKRVHDCAGLIKGYLWSKTPTSTPKYNAKQDYGATGFYNKAKKKGTMSSFKKVAGQLVFKGNSKTKTHVGVYIGGNTVIEAKGHAWGVIKSKLSSGGWKYWAQCHLIKDDTSKPKAKPTTPAPKPVPPTTTPAPKPTAKPKPKYAGSYKVTAEKGLNMRSGAGTSHSLITTLKKGTKVTCAGDNKIVKGKRWLKVTAGKHKGWCISSYLKKT